MLSLLLLFSITAVVVVDPNALTLSPRSQLFFIFLLLVVLVSVAMLKYSATDDDDDDDDNDDDNEHIDRLECKLILCDV